MAKNKLYEKNQTELFKMSRTKVQLFTECPRCFYLDTSPSLVQNIPTRT